jgi:DNA-binding PadR family transcriptional regulator
MPVDPIHISLSELELQILLQIAREPTHGYALMRQIAAASRGWLKPGPGALYVALRRLLNGRLIAETSGPSTPAPGRTRRYYRITARGRYTVAQELRRLARIVRSAEDAGWVSEIRI